MTGDSDDFLDIKQAAKLLNVSETSLRRWTNSGELAAYRIGRRRERRFRRSDLFAFMAAPSGGSVEFPDKRIAKAATESRAASNKDNHYCGFYSSEAGRARLAAAFLVDGATDGAAKFLIAEPNARGSVLKAVKSLARSSGSRSNRDRLATDVYCNSIKSQIEYWERSFEEALADGATSLRVVGDACGFTKRMSFAALIRYEAEYERLIAQRYPVATLCLYDARLLSGRDALLVLKEHGDTFRPAVDTVLD